MNKTKIVSVLVTTYNHKDYIQECIESILKQKVDFEFEIIIGVDECDDGTEAICFEMEKKHSKIIKVIVNKSNNVLFISGKRVGRYNFLNILKQASGKYIARCDGDDFWLDENKLQKQFEILESNQEIICVHSWQKIYVRGSGNEFHFEDAPKLGHGYLEQTISGVEEIFSNKMRPKSRTICFRNIFSDFKFPDWYYQVQFGDEALNFILGKFGKFYFINEELAVYRLTKQGASSVFLNENGQILGVKAWLKLWNSASKYHDNKFLDEATEGMTFFIKRTIKKKNINRLNKISFIFWIFYTSSIQLKLKSKIFRNLIKRKK